MAAKADTTLAGQGRLAVYQPAATFNRKLRFGFRLASLRAGRGGHGWPL